MRMEIGWRLLLSDLRVCCRPPCRLCAWIIIILIFLVSSSFETIILTSLPRSTRVRKSTRTLLRQGVAILVPTQALSNFISSTSSQDQCSPLLNHTYYIYRSRHSSSAHMAYRSPGSSPSDAEDTLSSSNVSPSSTTSPLAMIPGNVDGSGSPSSRSNKGTPNRIPLDLPRTQTASKGGCW